MKKSAYIWTINGKVDFKKARNTENVNLIIE